MLRRGLAALMMGVVCAGSVTADDGSRSQNRGPQRGVAGWMSTRGQGVRSQHAGHSRASVLQRADVTDLDSQSGSVLQTSGNPQDDIVVVGQQFPRPVPIEQAPVLPNTETTTGPQYFSSAAAAGFSNPVPVYPGQNWQQYSAPVSAQATSAAQFSPISQPGMAQPMMGSPGPVSQNLSSGGYPQTGASLYPAPIPGIPQQIGGTVIYNAALQPHEMLYAHRYRAMYPPYYYKVNGGWMVTPFGVWSHEDWKLQGTMVDVKYKSRISPFTFYKGR